MALEWFYKRKSRWSARISEHWNHRSATHRIVTKFVLFVETQHGTVPTLFLEIRRLQPRHSQPFGLPFWALTKGGSVLRFDS